MQKPDIPANESTRIAALCGLNILDTPPEARFDRITRIAQQHFKVPIALVSLVDTERQWFKSRQGLDAPETSRDISFCGHAILSETIFHIPNALNDPRFADNPLVTGDLHLRFYAGAPLHSPEGERVGTLCIIDRVPRQFAASELSVLRDLADGVEAELERTRLLQTDVELRRFKHVLDNTHDMIFMFDRDSLQFIYLNQGAVTNMGYSKDELLRMHPFDIKPEFPEAKFRSMIEPLRVGQTQVLNFETVHRRKDGSEFPVAITLQLIREVGGSSRFVAVVHDISVRRRSEAALSLLLDRLDVATRAGGIGIWDWDIVNNTLTWDERMFTLYGVKREDFGAAYEAWLAGVYPDDRAHCDQAIQQALNNTARYDIEFRVCWPDGTLRDIKANGDVIWNAQGKAVRMTGVNYDITHRKQNAQRIQAAENRIRAIVETVVDGIISINAHGIIQTVNPATEQIFGYSREEMLGHNIKRLMPNPYHDAHDGYLHNYLTTGKPKVIGVGREVTGQRKDGSTFPMEIAVSEMEVNGERMFTGIVRDITERKNIERLKSEFISTVSHELRTPLTSIRGALNLVLGKSASQLPEQARRMLEMAERNSERLTMLINDILDLEKIEAGRLEFDFKSIDLNTVSARALEDNEGYARKHHVRLRLECHPQPALVWADEHRLLQVFANLLSNAVKYSPPNGEVSIVLSARGAGYRIAVRDAGAGIPEEFRSRIFQRFAQADSSDTRKKGGTGLGLSITKAIVERHGGRLGYYSQLGVGTEFQVDLPAHDAVMPTLEATGYSPDAIRVLICEDHPDVAQILSAMIEREGARCDRVGSAADARRLLAQHTYRLLLLDLTLPDADGLTFLRELRDTHATEHLPIIVVSGRAQEGCAAFSGDALTVVDWIQKPVQPERLGRALRDALRRTMRPQVLHVEDDPDVIQITLALFDNAVDFTHANNLSTARQQLMEHPFDLVILDLGLADGSGIELLDELKGRCPVVIFSAQTLSRDITDQVAAALTKSVTSNAQLLRTIQQMLHLETATP